MSLMKIDNLFHFEKGSLQSSKCTEGKFDFITASSEWKTHNEYTHDCEALVFAAAASGSLGRTHYVNGKFISSDLCFIITPKDPVNLPIDLKFYHMIFDEFKNDIVKNTKAGTSKEAIGMKAFGNYKLPYFDIDKQVEAKIQFVNLQHSKIELNSELTHQLDLIKQLRQAFLREAMQGKLVKSTNTKETGQQLLEKIKTEKAQLIAEKKLKKEKELPPISADEIPFEIPEHWAWCRLGESIYDTDSGKSPNCLNESVIEKQWGVIKTTAIQEMFFLENENKILPEKFIVNQQHKICEGDILITRAGPKNRVGVVCCVEKLTNNLILSDKTIRIKFSKKLLSPKYYTIALNSPLIKKVIEKKMSGMADSQVNITQDNIKSFPIPLPPLHEQEQIVAKLEELMAFCDGLEQSIKESQGYNEMLLQQVLREALQPSEKV
jgi:type I restriction enzyme S subunit